MVSFNEVCTIESLISCLMSKQAFGLSLQSAGKRAVILQPPNDKSKGAIFVSECEKVWRLELSDSMVAQHRIAAGIPEPIPKQDSVAANYAFINDTLKEAVNRGSFDVVIQEDTSISVRFRYCIASVDHSGVFAGFTEASLIDLLRATTIELNRVYSDIEVMLKDASDQGLTLDLKSEKIDPLKAQKIKEMSLMRKHVSAADPTVRNKKIQRGFGSR